MFVYNQERIKERLEIQNLTQAQLSEMVGVSQSTLSQIFSGRQKTVNLDTIYKICKILNLKINEIIIDDSIQIKTKKDIVDELIRQIDKLYNVTVSFRAIEDFENETGEEGIIRSYEK